MPVAAGAARAAFCACSTRSPTPISPASTGSRAPTLEARAAALLPALLLARIDGKSPVEYITEARDEGPGAPCSRAASSQPARIVWRIREAWATRRCGHERDATLARARPPRLGFARPAHGRGRGDACRRRTSAAPSRRPALRPARGEAVDLRDGGSRFGGARRDGRGRRRQRRDRRGARRPRRRATRPASTPH